MEKTFLACLVCCVSLTLGCAGRAWQTDPAKIISLPASSAPADSSTLAVAPDEADREFADCLDRTDSFFGLAFRATGTWSFDLERMEAAGTSLDLTPVAWPDSRNKPAADAISYLDHLRVGRIFGRVTISGADANTLQAVKGLAAEYGSLARKHGLPTLGYRAVGDNDLMSDPIQLLFTVRDRRPMMYAKWGDLPDMENRMLDGLIHPLELTQYRFLRTMHLEPRVSYRFGFLGRLFSKSYAGLVAFRPTGLELVAQDLETTRYCFRVFPPA